MNKDALMASIIGFTIGLLITAVLLFGPKLVQGFPQLSLPSFSLGLGNAPADESDETAVEQPLLDLDDSDTTLIDQPENNAVVFEDTITISGTAENATLIVISGFADDIVSPPAAGGTYSESISLEEGRNDILVTAYEDGKPVTDSVTVYYTQDEF